MSSDVRPAGAGVRPAGDLPVGRIAFVLTDVEGSTRLWERHIEAMSEVMARHDDIVREHVEANGGVLLRHRGEGDSTFSVFAEAAAAVRATIGFQAALAGTSWPTGEKLRVRCAIHVGEADLREGDYYGPVVNRCARLRAIAHGGQTIVSRAAYLDAYPSLAPPIAFTDLGRHRLKDLEEPEHVWQVDHPGLDAAFPPLTSLDVVTHNLPSPVTSFVGRERELDDVRDALTTSRLVSLVGPGGIGKTRLAFEVAASVIDRFDDGVWLCELAATASDDLVPSTVAKALGVRDTGAVDMRDVLVDALRESSLLLVLDNCEHLVGAVAKLVDEVLRACPDVRVLATTREPLRIDAEQVIDIGPLGAPDDRSAPVALFVDRARRVRRTFDPSGHEATIERICSGVDDMPLAIELAAARTRVLTLDAMAERLDHVLDLLGHGSRTAPDRHQALRDSIEWSYELLNDVERLLFRRLAVFTGGASLPSIEAVCLPDGSDAFGVVDLLDALVEKSLVVRGDGELRYAMLETIRAYGLEQLQAADGDRIHRRHLEHMIELGAEVERHATAPDQGAWYARLDLELANARAALAYGLSFVPDRGAALADTLRPYYIVRGLQREAERTYVRCVELRRSSGDRHGLATSLRNLAAVAEQLGNHELASASDDEALAIFRELGDDLSAAKTLTNIGQTALDVADYDRARSAYEEALAIYRAIPDEHGEASSLTNLGNIDNHLGRAADARAAYERSIEILRRIGDKRSLGITLYNLANAANDLGAHDVERTALEEALAILRELGDPGSIARVLNGLGDAAMSRSEFHEARERFEEALAIFRDLGSRQAEGVLLLNAGNAKRFIGDVDGSVENYEDAVRVLRDVGDRDNLLIVLNNLGSLLRSVGRYERARAVCEEALGIADAIGSPFARADVLIEMCALALVAGDRAAARDAIDESMTILRSIDGASVVSLGRALDLRGSVAIATDDLEAAHETYAELTDLGRRTDNLAQIANGLSGLGSTLARTGDHDGALRAFEEAVPVIRARGEESPMITLLEEIANLDVLAGRPQRAATLLGACATARRVHGIPAVPSTATQRERLLGRLRSAIDDETFDRCWKEGAGLTLVEASERGATV